jgi:CO/xanthine dehydrogenase FAD-binding subunit
VQIQNTATVAGNLCNASPAADGVPALLVLDAEVELRSVRGQRRVPLAHFILGNRRTAREVDELVTAVIVPDTAVRGRSAFVKLGGRRYLVISIAMAAVRVDLDGEGRIATAAVAVGSCSAVAQRLAGVERALVGSRPDATRDVLATVELPELSPIGDVRASAGYRLDAAREIVARAVVMACQTSDEARAA